MSRFTILIYYISKIFLFKLYFVITTALPVITKHPDDNGNITVAVGSDVTLSCEATGDGKLNYQWKRESGSFPSNRSGRSTKSLTIRNIAVSDSGQYYCEVDNGGDRVSSRRVQVTVKSRVLKNSLYSFSDLWLIIKNLIPLYLTKF